VHPHLPVAHGECSAARRPPAIHTGGDFRSTKSLASPASDRPEVDRVDSVGGMALQRSASCPVVHDKQPGKHLQLDRTKRSAAIADTFFEVELSRMASGRANAKAKSLEAPFSIERDGSTASAATTVTRFGSLGRSCSILSSASMDWSQSNQGFEKLLRVCSGSVDSTDVTDEEEKAVLRMFGCAPLPDGEPPSTGLGERSRSEEAGNEALAFTDAAHLVEDL